MEKIKCPICDSDSNKFFTKKNGFNHYKCLNCGLIFLFPLPKSIEVYDASYFSGATKGFGYVDYDADKEPMIPTFNKYLDLIESFGFKSGKLLDIGSATGFFMALAKNRGFDCVGVEFSPFASELGRRKGFDIKTGDILDQKFPDESFDVVTMFDVVEHIPNPKDVLMEVRRVLKKDGLLIINTPDSSSFFAKILGKRWHLIMPPEHINYFSPKILGDYLTKNGFMVLVNTKIGKKFTLQYVIKMLYKWQGFRIFLLSNSFNKLLSKIYIPINLRDNFFMILKKK